MADKSKRAPIPQSVRFSVLRRDDFTCRYCGRASPEVVLHLDHKKPVSAGGGDEESNLITACQDCNLGKGAKVDVCPPIAAQKAPSPETGLVGMFGHSLTEEGRVNWQFYVARKVGGAYALQLFNWTWGEPTDIVFKTEAELTGPGYQFYETEAEWVAGAERNNRRFNHAIR